jgi:hypothetical protein
MYNLLFVLVAPFSYLGTYQDLQSCQFAIREMIAIRMNVPGQRSPELNKTIDILVQNSKEFLCVPVKK